MSGEEAAAVPAGAGVGRLPSSQSSQQVAAFVAAVAGRAPTCLLLETAAATVRVERIAAVGGVDEIHVGLNDLHASMGLAFMHELLAGGVLDELASRIRAVAPAIRFGFGGGALLDAPHPVPPRDVLREHVRLGSRMIILSRTFTGDATSEAELAARVDLPAEIAKIRQAVAAARARTADETERGRLRIRELNWRGGDMGLVGPRPAAPAQLGDYTAEQRRVRASVRPGITGLAQVSGRSSLSNEESVAFDLWYATHASVGTDLRILVRTAGAVLGRKGTN